MKMDESVTCWRSHVQIFISTTAQLVALQLDPREPGMTCIRFRVLTLASFSSSPHHARDLQLAFKTLEQITQVLTHVLPPF